MYVLPVPLTHSLPSVHGAVTVSPVPVAIWHTVMVSKCQLLYTALDTETHGKRCAFSVGQNFKVSRDCVLWDVSGCFFGIGKESVLLSKHTCEDTSKSPWKMRLKGKFILVQMVLKSMQFFHNCIFMSFYEDHLYAWISISFCPHINLIFHECLQVPHALIFLQMASPLRFSNGSQQRQGSWKS